MHFMGLLTSFWFWFDGGGAADGDVPGERRHLVARPQQQLCLLVVHVEDAGVAPDLDAALRRALGEVARPQLQHQPQLPRLHQVCAHANGCHAQVILAHLTITNV